MPEPGWLARTHSTPFGCTTSYLGSTGTGRGSSHEDIYSYSFFVGGAIIYAVWLGIVLLIAVDRFDLLALRRARSWKRSLKLGAVVIVGILVWESVASYLPLPQSPGKEQGITNVHWEPSHAGAFAGDFGLWVRTAGDAFRYRKQLDAEHIRLLFNINAVFA